MFDYPPMTEVKTTAAPTKVATAILSTTAKTKARKGKDGKKEEEGEKMEVVKEEAAEKKEGGEKADAMAEDGAEKAVTPTLSLSIRYMLD